MPERSTGYQLGREQLSAALKDMVLCFQNAERLTKTEAASQIYSGTLRYPDQVAEEILAEINWRPDEVDTRPLEDPELIAAQQILDALAPLETTDPAAVLRVLRWARERYDL